jgi:uncharacterized protein YgiB involved in biofilm formation
MTNSTRAYRAHYMAELKRRRSRWLAILACTSSALAMLGGCGNPSPQNRAWDAPATEDVLVYNSLSECKAAQADDRICDEAQSDAAAWQNRQPGFSQKEQCEAEYGVGHCETRSGGGWFVPAMAGFMLARSLDGMNIDGYRHRKTSYGYAPSYPVYVNNKGYMSTYGSGGARPLGYHVPQNSAGRTLPGRIAVQPDPSGGGYAAPGTYTGRPTTTASSRGGFGGSSAAHGGCCG